MDKNKKKEIFKAGIVLALSIILLCASLSYQEETVKPTEEIITPKTVIVTTTKPKFENTSYFPIESLPSPFSLIPSAINNNISDGNISYQNTKKIPNGTFPFPVGGSSKSSNTIQGYEVIVKAIFYKNDGNNMVIISNGSEDIIANENESTKWGKVSNITENSILLNKNLLTLDHKARGGQ